MPTPLVHNNNVTAKLLAEALKPLPQMTFEAAEQIEAIKVHFEGLWFNIEIPKNKYSLVYKAIVPLKGRRFEQLGDRLALAQNINSRGEGLAWAVLGGEKGESILLYYVFAIAGGGVALDTIANVSVIFGRDLVHILKKHELI